MPMYKTIQERVEARQFTRENQEGVLRWVLRNCKHGNCKHAYITKNELDQPVMIIPSEEKARGNLVRLNDFIVLEPGGKLVPYNPTLFQMKFIQD